MGFHSPVAEESGDNPSPCSFCWAESNR